MPRLPGIEQPNGPNELAPAVAFKKWARDLKSRCCASAILALGLLSAFRACAAEGDLERGFAKDVRPFLESYCISCHDQETRKAQLDLSSFGAVDDVVKDCARWELVLERLRNGEMPPKKAREQPPAEARKTIVAWIESFREREAQRTAGDPGPVPARRLSNSEYDSTIRDVTGVDIRPTRAFPVDPANQAGF